MADAAARREARRRKILENSENRLKRITGVEQKSEISIDGLSLNKTVSDDNREPLNEINDFIPQYRDDVELVSREQRVLEKLDFATYLADYRVSIILLIALGYSFLLKVFIRYERSIDIDVKNFYLNKIFIPLLLYELIDVIYSPPPSISNLQMLMVLGSRSKFLSPYLHYFGRLMKLMKDVCLYFVFFTICYYILGIF